MGAGVSQPFDALLDVVEVPLDRITGVGPLAVDAAVEHDRLAEHEHGGVERPACGIDHARVPDGPVATVVGFREHLVAPVAYVGHVDRSVAPRHRGVDDGEVAQVE